MDLGIFGHAAIVQASSKGIGFGIAEALAREGVNLVLTGRNQEALTAAANRLSVAYGVGIRTHVADSADTAAACQAVDVARAEFGRLDIVVANSGGPPPGGVLDLTADQWRAAAELLLVAPVELLRAALPLLRESPAPRFLVVTSSSTREPVAGLALSNTMRPGVVGLIKTMAGELGPLGVRCHSLAPGRIATDRLDAVIAMQAGRAGKTPGEIRAAMLGTIPAGRLGSTADMGSLAAFLCSPRADYLTGGNWLVDGGLIKSL
jgi:3-oxoacyl-[acyl-carrier protein] reductase